MPSAPSGATPPRTAAPELFGVSALILFLELACIRWLPSHVLFLTFFTNTVLLASFLGMSVGCLIARRPYDHLRLTPYWLALTLGAGLGFEWLNARSVVGVGVGDVRRPEVVFFGTESHGAGAADFFLPIELVAGFFFLMVALTLVGPGQELGRAFNRVPQRVRAYTLNILGSLAGIVLFALCSWLWLPPVAWFGLTALGVGVFLRRLPPPREPVPAWRSRPAGMAALAGAVLLAVPTAGLTDRGSAEGQTFWSPYYRIDYYPYWRSIRTNLIGHQVMIPLGGRAPAYALPHMLHRDAGGAPFERVLIIGAGSGNDLSRALAWGTPQTRIDAVEIDPVIQHLGTLDHPDRPYDDPRVTVHNDDGRNFLRRAAERDPGSYDLIEYALVDSLVLHSGYSNLRLESYLFTREAFADVRRCLKPGGLFVAYNYFRQGWIAARLRDGLREAFGSDPVVLTIPARDEVKLGEAFGGFTLFIAGSPEATAPIRRAFESAPSYWVRLDRGLTPGQSESGFREVLSPPRSAGPAEPARPAAGVSPTPLDRVEGVEYIGGHPWMRFTPASLEESGGSLRPATDDWPFLYLREPTIPALTLRGMGVMALVALGMLLAFRDRPQSGDETAAGTAPAAGPANLELRMFCLGAGFMLIETKAVVQTALLFGSTWMVNTFVFAAVLVMILLANLYVLALRPRSPAPYYLGLFAALGVSALVPLDAFLGMSPGVQAGLACLLVFAPIAFAGVVFAVSFSRVVRPDRAIGANVAGAMAGGLAENASLVVGFQGLLLVALAFYLASTWAPAKAP